MKRKWRVGVLMAAAIVMVGGCGTHPEEEQLVGVWRLQSDRPSSVEVRYEADRTCTMILTTSEGIRATNSGFWSLKGRTLTQTDGAGNAGSVEVRRLDETHLTILLPDGSTREFIRLSPANR